MHKNISYIIIVILLSCEIFCITPEREYVFAAGSNQDVTQAVYSVYSPSPSPSVTPTQSHGPSQSPVPSAPTSGTESIEIVSNAHNLDFGVLTPGTEKIQIQAVNLLIKTNRNRWKLVAYGHNFQSSNGQIACDRVGIRENNTSMEFYSLRIDGTVLLSNRNERNITVKFDYKIKTSIEDIAGANFVGDITFCIEDIELREVYRGLMRIEDAFKITKTEFDSRPIFVRTNEHIDAHFTTCFTALVLIRLLQTKLENKYPVGKIINALKNYCCVPVDASNYQFTYYDEILNTCASVFNMELDNKYRTRQQIQRILRY